MAPQPQPKKRKVESRSDWVAVESKVSKDDMGPKIEKAKTAFMYFQKRNMQTIRDELQAICADTDEQGGNDDSVAFDLGTVQREVSARWHRLTAEERKEYEDLAFKDKERYDDECLKRDQQVEEERRQKREEREAEIDGKRERQAHQLVTARPVKEMRQLTEAQIEAKKLTDEVRHQAREEKNALKNEIAQQHADVKRKHAEAAQARLKYLLGQSDIFAHFGQGMKVKEEGASSRKRMTEHEEDESMLQEKHDVVRLSKQPSCIKFGTMRDYQLEGLNWMVNLSNRGVNGILADEMGLGKTLQTISILAYHHEFKNTSGPHIVLVPKSTLGNWLNEFKRWCPVLRTVKFHGSREERDDVINNVLCPGLSSAQRKFDVCVTTFEMCIKEKSVLQKFAWKYLVIDEAHRIKNEASLFSRVVRSLIAEHRLLLTGTPLQNNLHEMWALLNFLIPDVFSSSEQFDEWFNLDVEDEEAKKKMIRQLHRVLHPFMLRRLKSDVEKSLPPKKETLLFVGMSDMQKSLYKSLLLRDMDAVTGNSSSKTALQNIVMQLRKATGHPYLFEGQEDRTLDPLGEHLIENCGKLVLLDKLLARLKERGSRVLVFSQMTRVLDILEDFCRMRRYQYCRIDGQTTYEDREESIDVYNAPNSEKFVFLLSTRAGGLGINLATADTVILYDSDWNPQADLQAQDRAHRIGQKKQVNVYRLVTANSVEEKIVERAQQKLKLDAMVVQQGRLQETNQKLSKTEMLEMIRFGADQVFKASGSMITDDDIDAILAEGEQRTEEMKKKLEEVDKGDLMDFRLDGGDSVQIHDGVDYSKEKERAEELKRLELEFALHLSQGMGKRERKPVTNYSVDNYYRKEGKKRGNTLPKALRFPKMEEWQFYQRARLIEIHEQECAAYEETKDMENPPTEFIPLEMQKEKQRLLEEAFKDWTKPNFNTFVKLTARYGRENIDDIARDLGKDRDNVARYMKVFWERGSELSDFDRIKSNIEKGESKLLEIKTIQEQTAIKISQYANPWDTMTMNYLGRQGKVYTEEEDRYLLCLAHRHGYGNWEKVKQDICRSERFLFDYFLRSRTASEIGRRCDTLMRMCEKDNVEYEIKENKERQIREKQESERLDLERRLAEARAEMQQHQGKVDQMILHEAKKLQDQLGIKKRWKARLKFEKNESLPDEGTVEGVFGEFLRYLSKSKKSDVMEIALGFVELHPSVSVKEAMKKIKEVATMTPSNSGETSSWSIKEEMLSKMNEAPKSPRKRKAPPADTKTPAKKAKSGTTTTTTTTAAANAKTSKAQVSSTPPTAKPSSNPKKVSATKASKKEKEGKAQIKKPRSAYVLFSLSKRAEVKSDLPSGASIIDLMGRLTEIWKDLSEDEKTPWIKAAEEDLKRYNDEMAALTP